MKTLIINPGSTGIKIKTFHNGKVIDQQVLNLKDLASCIQSKHLDIGKVVIRVVHGGPLVRPVKITNEVKNIIQEYSVFAPLHNQLSLDCISLVEEILPNCSQFACFDTSFHTSIQKAFYTYPINIEIASKYNIRKYGFHGLAIESALTILREEKPLPRKIILIHLGGGCSVTAIKNEKSFCTSMGLTPLSGIMMTTRSGNIDPSIFPVLESESSMSFDEINTMLNSDSGFKGLTDSVDTLDIFNKAANNIEKHSLAFDIFINSIIEHVYAYAGHMQGVDHIIFTGGIGFGNKYLRSSVISKLGLLNIDESKVDVIDIDEEKLMFDITKSLT